MIEVFPAATLQHLEEATKLIAAEVLVGIDPPDVVLPKAQDLVDVSEIAIALGSQEVVGVVAYTIALPRYGAYQRHSNAPKR